MVRSMTGFGQAEIHIDDLNIQVELKSVNHRYGEFAFRLPREWLIYEDQLKKLIQHHVRRGRVDVFVTAEHSDAANSGLDIDWQLAEGYLAAAT